MRTKRIARTLMIAGTAAALSILSIVSTVGGLGRRRLPPIPLVGGI